MSCYCGWRITNIVGSSTNTGLPTLQSVGGVRAIIDHLQAAVHTGGPAVLDPLRHALFTAHSDG
jgi:hypothetical protein